MHIDPVIVPCPIDRAVLESLPASALEGADAADLAGLLLAGYALESARAWEACIESAERDGVPARVAHARAAAAEAAALWETALAAGTAGTVRDALEEARRLAAHWGDDAPERAAIRALTPPR